MTFPTTFAAEASAVRVWGRMVGHAQMFEQHALAYRAISLAETLDESTLLELGRRLKPMMQYFQEFANTPGLQAYARQATGNATFDLVVELTALRDAVNAVFAAGRQVLALLRANLADDGTVTEAPRTLTAQQATPFIAALDALIAQIN